MDIHEFKQHIAAYSRYKGWQDMTLDTYQQAIEPLYILLDVDKATFADIVNIMGYRTITQKSGYYQTCLRALDNQHTRDQYNANKARLESLQDEQIQLQLAIDAYEDNPAYTGCPF